jgi:hypothetical protein
MNHSYDVITNVNMLTDFILAPNQVDILQSFLKVIDTSFPMEKTCVSSTLLAKKKIMEICDKVSNTNKINYNQCIINQCIHKIVINCAKVISDFIISDSNAKKYVKMMNVLYGMKSYYISSLQSIYIKYIIIDEILLELNKKRKQEFDDAIRNVNRFIMIHNYIKNAAEVSKMKNEI